MVYVIVPDVVVDIFAGIRGVKARLCSGHFHLTKDNILDGDGHDVCVPMILI